MRIVHVYSDCTRSRGIGRYVLALAEGAAAAGHDVHLVHAGPCSSPVSGVSLHFVNVVRWPHVLEMVQFARSSLRRVRQLAPHLIHTHGDVLYGDIVTAHSCHKRGMRIRRDLRESRGPRNLGIVDALRLHYEERLYRYGAARHVIAHTAGVKRELQEEYSISPDRITVIPNGVDLELFGRDTNSSARFTVRRELGISGEDIALLIVANEFDRKGLRVVIDALSLLRDSRTWLLVAGADETAPYNALAERRGVSGRIRFLGVPPRLEQIYAAADIFVMPSYYETFSLATLEAAASGLPLVVTKISGTDELVANGDNGFFVSRDPDDVASKVRLLIEDPLRRAHMSARARRSAEPYGWPAIVGRVLDLYSRHSRLQT